MTDLFFTPDGDFRVSPSGDLETTDVDKDRSIFQQIHTVLMASLGDWELYPELNTGLDEMIGLPNTRSTANEISRRVTQALKLNTSVRLKNVSVKPINIHNLVIMLDIQGSNQLESTIQTRMLFLFSLSEKKIVFAGVE